MKLIFNYTLHSEAVTFVEVYHRIYCWKFSFLLRCMRRVVKHDFQPISNHLSDDIPPQMNSWDINVPILMYFTNIFSHYHFNYKND